VVAFVADKIVVRQLGIPRAHRPGGIALPV
jgi:hypothetical protein